VDFGHRALMDEKHWNFCEGVVIDEIHLVYHWNEMDNKNWVFVVKP